MVSCIEHIIFLSSLLYSVDGNYCITSGTDKTVKLWNPLRKLHLKTYTGCGQEVLDVASSSDNTMILAGGRDKQPTLFDVESGKILKRWKSHGGAVNAVETAVPSLKILS